MSRVTIDGHNHTVDEAVAGYIKKLRKHITLKRGKMKEATEMAFKLMEQSFPMEDRNCFKNSQYRMAVHDVLECLKRYGLIVKCNWVTGEITMPEGEVNE